MPNRELGTDHFELGELVVLGATAKLAFESIWLARRGSL